MKLFHESYSPADTDVRSLPSALLFRLSLHSVERCAPSSSPLRGVRLINGKLYPQEAAEERKEPSKAAASLRRKERLEKELGGEGAKKRKKKGTATKRGKSLCVSEVILNLSDSGERRDFLKQLPDILPSVSANDIVHIVAPLLLLLLEMDIAGLEVAQAFPELFESAKGYGTESDTLFTMAHSLLTHPDAKVAQESVEKIRHFLRKGESEARAAQWTGMVVAMAQSPWARARESAARLLSEVKDDDRCPALFVALARDNTIGVRCAVVKSLPLWVKRTRAPNHQRFFGSLMRLFGDQMENDEVRRTLGEVLVELARGVHKDAISSTFTEPLRVLQKDISWRVRYEVATHFAACVATAVERQIDPLVIFSAMLSLAKDNAMEVRVVVAMQLADVAKAVSSAKQIMQHILPVTSALLQSGDEEYKENNEANGVRRALAISIPIVVSRLWDSGGGEAQSAAGQLMRDVFVPLLGASELAAHATYSSILVPSDVRQCAIEGLQWVPPGLFATSKGLRSHVDGALQLGSSDDRWRSRYAVAAQLRHMASFMPHENFNARMLATLRRLLDDDVAKVRRAAVDSLEVVARSYGARWSAVTLLSLSEFAQASVFSRRVTWIRCMAVLTPMAAGRASSSAPHHELERHLATTVKQLLTDKVPQVRQTLVEALWTVVERPFASSTLKAVLSTLAKDQFLDVRNASSTSRSTEPF